MTEEPKRIQKTFYKEFQKVIRQIPVTLQELSSLWHNACLSSFSKYRSVLLIYIVKASNAGLTCFGKKSIYFTFCQFSSHNGWTQ